MADNIAPVVRHRPIAMLTIGLALNFLLQVWFGYFTITSLRQLEDAEARHNRSGGLRERIRLLDQSMTGSARMAAQTGSLTWEKRYLDHEAQLQIALQEAKTLCPETHADQLAADTAAANQKLVVMEKNAFALIRENNLPEARRTLYSEDYEEQKRIYNASIGQWSEAIEARLATDFRRRESHTTILWFVGAAVLVFTLGAWLATIRTVGRWMRDRMRGQIERQMHSSLLDQIGDLITATDLKGRITYVNAAQAEALGQTKEELLGKHVAAYGVDPGRGAAQEEILERTLEDGHWNGEVINYGPDGEPKVVALHTWHVRDENGEPIGLTGVGRDVTDIRRTQEELIKARDELERRVEERTRELVNLNRELKAEITQRKAAEEAANRAKKEWERTFDSVPDLIAIIDNDYKIARINKAMAERLGHTPAECVGKTCYEVVHETDSPPPFCPHAQTVQDGHGHHAEIYEEGLQGHFALSTSPLLDETGQSIESVHVAHDITERIEAESALRENEARLKQAQELAHIGSWQWDVATNTFHMSEELRRIYGLPEDWDGVDALEIIDAAIHPDDRDRMRAMTADFRADPTAQPLASVFRVARPDGRVRWVSESAPQVYERDADGRASVLIGTLQDVTDLKNAENELRESEQRFRTLFESSRDAIMTLAPPSWKFTSCNQATVEMFGATDEAHFATLGPWELSPKIQPDGRPSAEKAQEMIETAMRTGSNLFEWTHKRVDGTEFPATVLLTRMELGEQTFLQATVRNISRRKEAEQALLESENRYRALFEGSSEGVLVADVETTQFLYANPAICTMTGYTVDELTQRSLPDIHPADQLERVSDNFRSQSRGEIRLAPNIPFLRKDGNIFYADVNSAVVELDGRRCAVGFITDITERHQAEEALRESEERYRTVFEGASEGIVVVDLQTNALRYANPALCTMLGHTTQEMLQMTVAGIHPPDQLDEIMAEFGTHIEGRKRRSEAIPCLRADGSMIFADITTAQALIDGRPCLMGFFTDVTERTRAERALHDSERRYRQLVENLTEGIAALDQEGRITFVNEAFVNIVGDTEEMLLGSDFFGSTVPMQKEQFRQAFLSANAPRGYYEANFQRRDEQVVNLSIQGSPILDDQDNQVGILVVINDITLRRQAEESLRAAHRRLMSASERERRDLARSLHDSLGQQAVAMRLGIEALVPGAADADERRAERLAQLSHNCRQLTGEIRAVCYGLYPATLEALGLHAALEQLGKECRPAMATKVKCDKGLRELRAPGDVEIALFRIAQEAASNAMRHSRGANLRIALKQPDHALVLTVSDNGGGFDIHQAERTGLGLRTMHERASAIGGRLEVESSTEGTTIRVVVETGLSDGKIAPESPPGRR